MPELFYTAAEIDQMRMGDRWGRPKTRVYRFSGRIVSLSDGPTRLRIQSVRGVSCTTDFMGVGPFQQNVCITGAIHSVQFVPSCTVSELKMEILK